MGNKKIKCPYCSEPHNFSRTFFKIPEMEGTFDLSVDLDMGFDWIYDDNTLTFNHAIQFYLHDSDCEEIAHLEMQVKYCPFCGSRLVKPEKKPESDKKNNKNANEDIKQYAKSKGINLWEVSEALGYAHETAFSRTLRHELSEENKQMIFKTIDKLAGTQ